MEAFDFIRAVHTNLAFSSLVLSVICVTALWCHRAAWRNDGYITLLGLAIKWVPATTLYIWYAMVYWVEGVEHRVLPPACLMLFFSWGLITGSAVLIARFQPWFANRLAVFTIWCCFISMMTLVMLDE